MVSLDDVIRQQLGVETDCGVLVNEVIPSSPADGAGLKRGDVILSVNGTVAEDVDGLKEIIAALSPGDRIRIVYVRAGVKYSCILVLKVSKIVMMYFSLLLITS